jgi:hypothetical protein
VEIRRSDYATPLYPQKLTLTSPRSGSRSDGIVRSRIQATEFVFLFFFVFLNVLTELKEFNGTELLFEKLTVLQLFKKFPSFLAT